MSVIIRDYPPHLALSRSRRSNSGRSFPVDEKPIFPFFVDWAFGGSQSTKNRFFRFLSTGPFKGVHQSRDQAIFCRLGLSTGLGGI